VEAAPIRPSGSRTPRSAGSATAVPVKHGAQGSRPLRCPFGELGGLEGVGFGFRRTPPNAFLAPPARCQPERRVDRRVAIRAVAANTQGSERQVSKVARFDKPRLRSRGNVKQVLPPTCEFQPGRDIGQGADAVI